MKQKLLLVFSLLLLCASRLAAQNQKITGTVTDAAGNTPLSGVSINVIGTRIGTVTDKTGRFTLEVPSAAGRKLMVSFINYRSQTVEINPGTPLAISLVPEPKGLDEAVVVGYGTQKRRDLTGAIATINSQEVNGRKTVQVSDALEGAIAGVTVTRNGASPGATSTIRFRGITTIGTNDPLIIVDGVPSGSIDNINPNDIESITALKDAASASIYGSRSAAGVLLVTTKRAKLGQLNLEYDYERGDIRPVSLPRFTDAIRYMQLYNEYSTNDGSAPLYSQATIDAYKQNNATDPDTYPNTDWQAAVLKKSTSRDIHTLSLTAGTDRVKTRASLGYSDTKGLYDNRSFRKYTGAVNNDFRITDQLSAAIDISLLRTENDLTSGENPVYAARVLPGIYAARYSDGRLAPGKFGRNPLAQIEQGGFDNTAAMLLTGRASLSYKPVNGLTITGLVSPSYSFTKESSFSKQISFTDLNDPSLVVYTNQANTTLTESRPYSYTFNAQLLANYNRTFNNAHNIDLLAGYEDNYNYTEYLTASRGSFTLSGFPYLDDGLLALRDNTGGASEYALRSYFGRLKYSYKDKYYLQANGRYDGSSRFSDGHRWAFFPSFSAGWTISGEDFFKQVRPVSFLKLRGSWGQAGNERIGNYPYQANITFNNALFYNNGAVVPETSGGQITYAINNITWETQQTTDLGLDVSFFDNRLSFSGDVFQKETRNILLQLNVPVYLGFAAPYQNAGKVSAKGWEATANWSDHIGEVKYSIGFNVSDAKTRIDDLKGTQQLGDQANIQGGEFMSWYGYRSSGLFQTQDEVNSSPVLSTAVKPGDVKYVDVSKDGKITPDKDKVLLGGSLPRYTFGVNGRLSYKRFDFSFALQGVGKVLSRLNSNTVEPFLEAFGNVPSLIDGKSWSPTKTAQQNLAAKYPRLSRASDGANYQLSDFWLINGNYLRVKNITLGYDIRSDIFRHANIKGLRVYIACNDLFTFSRFPKGSDPEVDASSYPIVRTIMAGVNVNF